MHLNVGFRFLCFLNIIIFQCFQTCKQETFTAEDERLNDHGYIVPGLGDAGDRIFGTK